MAVESVKKQKNVLRDLQDRSTGVEKRCWLHNTSWKASLFGKASCRESVVKSLGYSRSRFQVRYYM